MDAGLDIVLKTVPGADDMRAGFVERESVALAAIIDHFGNTRNNLPLANRSALVRALVEIRVKLAIDAEDSDRRLADVNHQASAFRHLFAGPYVNPLRCGWHIAPKIAPLKLGTTSAARNEAVVA